MEPAQSQTAQMGEMGKRPVQVRRHPMAAAAVEEEPRIVCPLEIGTTIACTGEAIYDPTMPGRLQNFIHSELFEAVIRFYK